MPGSALSAGQTMQPSCIDLGTTDASVWLAYSRSKRQPNSHRTASSERRKPTAVIGGAFNQSPACGAVTALSLIIIIITINNNNINNNRETTFFCQRLSVLNPNVQFGCLSCYSPSRDSYRRLTPEPVFNFVFNPLDLY